MNAAGWISRRRERSMPPFAFLRTRRRAIYKASARNISIRAGASSRLWHRAPARSYATPIPGDAAALPRRPMNAAASSNAASWICKYSLMVIFARMQNKFCAFVKFLDAGGVRHTRAGQFTDTRVITSVQLFIQIIENRRIK